MRSRSSKGACRKPISFCRASTGWCPCSSGGCWARTKARCVRFTWTTTSMSSRSDSTGGPHAREANSSTVWLNRQWRSTQCTGKTSRPVSGGADSTTGSGNRSQPDSPFPALAARRERPLPTLAGGFNRVSGSRYDSCRAFSVRPSRFLGCSRTPRPRAARGHPHRGAAGRRVSP